VQLQPRLAADRSRPRAVRVRLVDSQSGGDCLPPEAFATLRAKPPAANISAMSVKVPECKTPGFHGP
jgi:hypothetical protein